MAQQKEQVQIEVQQNNNLTSFKVFGSRPKNTIFLPQTPYGVRNDCKTGLWKVGDEDYRGKEIEISIIKVCNMFGSLGKTLNTPWLQVWFVAAPQCTVIPQATVCLTYLKKRSIGQFSDKITELMQKGEPALGIFKGSFSKHNGANGDYFSVSWDWHERTTEAEIQQLDIIAEFLSSNPTLIDLSVDLLSIDNLSTQEIQNLMASAKSQDSQSSTTTVK